MSIVDDLVELHKLLLAGAINKSEYETVKKQMISSANVSGPVKSALLSHQGPPSTFQFAGVAMAGTLGGRMISEHLHDDKVRSEALDLINGKSNSGNDNIDQVANDHNNDSGNDSSGAMDFLGF